MCALMGHRPLQVWVFLVCPFAFSGAQPALNFGRSLQASGVTLVDFT